MNRKNKTLIRLIGLIAAMLLINILATSIHGRFDLTKEKRYSLSAPTKQLFRNLEEPVQIDVFLTGSELPAVVRKFQNAIGDFLRESKEYGKNKLHYNFVNPYENKDTAMIRALEDSLNNYYGLTGIFLNAPDEVGDDINMKKLIHGAVVKYGDKTVGIDLLKGARSFGTEPEQLAELYNNVEASIEYKFASAIQKITAEKKPIVAYALGHGEEWGYNANDAVITLINEYDTDTINIKAVDFIPPQINAIVIAKPRQSFNDEDKLKIDQYLMNGGNVFLMVDNMYAEFDSLYQSQGFIAFDRGLNLEDLLFNYGVRINQSLLQDMECDKLPQVGAEGQQRRLVDWPFFPVLNGTDHPISKNLDGIRTLFPTTMDTVEAAGIKKTVLLRSSNNSRIINAPAKIDFEYLQIAPDQSLFRSKEIPVAVLLEGSFRSLYTGRVSAAVADEMKSRDQPFKSASEKGKIIVVSDGDIALNQYSPTMGALPMGMNLFTRYTFANKDFFINCLEYLVNPTDILQTRSKEYTLRLLDRRKVSEEKATWQSINILLPLLIVILCGITYQQLRKRKYAHL